MHMNSKFTIIRKTNSILLFVLGGLSLFMILLNAEAYYFGVKFNGFTALLFVGFIGLVGIVLGIFHGTNKRKADIPVVAWYVIFTSVIVGNRLF